MAVRIRENGRIFCAAMTQPEPGDTYIDDGLHYRLSVEFHAIVAEPIEQHTANGGEWWWANDVPHGVEVDRWWEKENRS